MAKSFEPLTHTCRWHRNSIGAAGSFAGPAWREFLNGQFSPWTIESGWTVGAFRIDVVPVENECGPNAVPLEDTCERATVPPAESRCWFGDFHQGNSYVFPLDGFPLNLNLLQCFGPSDFAPLSTDPLVGTSPLVSRETAHSLGTSPYRERATHHGVVDLITGEPMLKATDFELPFGGAVFRHIRTYSETVAPLLVEPVTDHGEMPFNGTSWDWNGLFWMMGENPILLLDARFPYVDRDSSFLLNSCAKRA